MTVRNLMDRLQEFNPDDEVYFSYDYGNYGHTLVAKPIEDVEDTPLVYSAYTRSMTLMDENDDESDPGEVETFGIVLS